MADQERIPPLWLEPCDLAWESLRIGSFPVGSVVRDRAGATVATGRNRGAERDVPAGQLGNTAIAHAEMNALAQLPADDYTEHTLYTTLEPCLLCTSALRICRVGTVEYLAPDPIWDGVADIPTLLNGRGARHWTVRNGPAAGPLATFCAVLPAYWYLQYRPAAVHDADPLASREHVRLAKKLRSSDVFAADTFRAALDLAWNELV
ncbi:MAG TPA: nucleoside deaminase [Mycobacteriales bacterium]|jgi:tRNA(Arg) A34 adenosine deaminase TadA|nr:nucleoside deaminase [Mycobacteriales bacterium]